MAQSCISLAGSTTCPAFNASSISTGVLPGQFPFLSDVTDIASFDSQLASFVGGAYVVQRYRNLFGCTNIDLSNTTDLYARYTYSFICNAIVQNSITTCNLSSAASRPLCVDSCADFALSEQRIVASQELCDSNSNNTIPLLRADFTNCALPADSISGICIPAFENEPDSCGYNANLEGLCGYCASSSVNATDSCCVTSDTETRCANVKLPTFTSVAPFLPTTTPSPASTPSSTPSGSGLSGGQIAGIVVGSVIGGLLLLGLLVCCCIFMRRRRQDAGTSLNQPTPPRSAAAMSQNGKPPPFEALPGARVTRMAALEGGLHDTSSPGQGESSGYDTSPDSQGARNGTVAAAGAVPQRRQFAGPGLEDFSSPESGDYQTPESNGRTERLTSFKDYYSQDDIHTGDYVSTLWAYQPRAPDEFELERGDMIKVIGIWDDGWATGVRIGQRAEDWSPTRGSGRDSVVSSESIRGTSSEGDIKALPLVCVCLPQHWRRTIEGEASSSPQPSD